MHYKTITLEMIRERPELYERLRSSKRLLPAMDAYAADLKAGHEGWKWAMARRHPGSDPSQIAAEALELAIRDLWGRLPCGPWKDAAGPTADAASGPRPLSRPE